MRRHFFILVGPLSCALLASCAIPPINLSTTEPIKVDINMRLDVYQHSDPGADTAGLAPGGARTDGGPVPVRREDWQADIQVFKNSRLVGENRNGLLTVLEAPPGDYGAYVRSVVARENDARNEEMRDLAEKERRSLVDIRREQAKLWNNRSFKGEWIELEQSDGSWKWVQKEG